MGERRSLPRVRSVRVGGELPDVKRSAHDVAADRRMGERRSLAQGEQRQWENCQT